MTTKSYRKINYSIRPAKAVERHILCEAFTLLRPFQPVRDYYYIGFGSVFFSDFEILHRHLGISRMTSIEKQENDRERLDFNRPHSCVEVIPGHSSAVLPDIDWKDGRTIAWLDYDGKIHDYVLDDISTFALLAESGSMLLVSVNVEPEQAPDSKTSVHEHRMSSFRKNLGDKSFPLGITSADLSGAKFAETCLSLMEGQLRSTLRQRNTTLMPTERLHEEQTVHILYSDNARMLTAGWVIVSEEEKPLFERCGFGGYHLGTRAIPRKIVIPSITIKEARAMNQQLPCSDLSELKGIPVPDKEKRQYAEIYRHFPAFIESDII